MPVPTEEEYGAMLGRLQNAMAFAAEELEVVANGVVPGLSEAAAADISFRLRKLTKTVMFRVGNDINDPAPTDLPDPSTPNPPVPH